ncbi:MAG: indole-3-glycerol phosphate synthase TrpC [Omnitrophica WOR_2 bacterium]
MSILDEIFNSKRLDLARRMQAKPVAEVRAEVEYAARPPLDFIGALRAARARNGRPALVAEVKHASPSRGILVQDFNPLHLAQVYRQNGAAAISVLTEERYFLGKLDDLAQIAHLFQDGERLPLLCKDFLCDPYQVYEARAAGADAVLLIAAYLEQPVLRQLHSLAGQLGMAALVEVHSLEELDKALACNPRLIGINNRDLHDFSVSLETTLTLKRHIPGSICVIAESGIHTPADIDCLAGAGVDAILVGEALVTASDVAEKIRSFSGKPQRMDELQGKK